jgi:hypothetical protein
VSNLVASAHALTVFRVLPDGEGREYTATTFPRDPWQGCERFIRTCRALGWITDRVEDDAFAVLDVLDEDGDIVQDFGIPDGRAFQRIKRKLNLRVARDEVGAVGG